MHQSTEAVIYKVPSCLQVGCCRELGADAHHFRNIVDILVVYARDYLEITFPKILVKAIT